ncbi:MAG: hypothetical protein ACRBM6_24055 [Geminicoccales bacterium]
MMVPKPVHRFQGYAVVSADGLIADADGRMPDQLKFDADWDYFQAALDRADVTLIGRATHEVAPNVKKRRRLVFSSRVQGMWQEDETTFWVDPTKTDPNGVITEIVGPSADVAVVGGQGVFDWVLSKPGFFSFHISLAHHVRIGSGRHIFRDAAGLEAAISLLQGHGLPLSRQVWFDQEAGLELLVYEKARGSQ